MLKNKIVSNTAINFAGKGLSYAVQLAVIAYIIGTIGKESYGVVVLALGLIGNVNLFESGFGLSVTKYIAEYNIKDNWEKINEIINTNFLLILVQNFIFAVLLFGLSHFLLYKLFNIPQTLQSQAVKVVDLFILTACANFFWTGLVRLAEGFQWYRFVRIAELGREILRAVLLLCFLYIQPTAVSVGVAYLLASLVSMVGLCFFVVSKEKRICLKASYLRWDTFKQMFSFSAKIFIAKIYAFISYRIDIFLIGFFLTTTSLTYYQIAYKLYELIKYVFSLVSSTIVPVTSELDSLQSKKKLALLFERATKYNIMLAYPIIVVLMAMTSVVINAWIGKGFGESVFLAQLFLISLLPVAIASCGTEMMIGLDNLAPLLKYNGIAAVINLVISLFLVQKIGIAGVIWGTVIGSLIIAVTYLRYMLGYFELSAGDFLRTTFLKAAALSLLLYVLLNIFPSVLMLVVGVTLYAVITFVYLVDASDKDLVYSYLRRTSS